MFVIFGRKRVAWSRLILVLILLLACYWFSQKSILPRQVLQERRILAETTTLRLDPKDEKAEFDESEIVDPSLSITVPTGDELTEKPPPPNNTFKEGPLPEVFAKKLKDYFFEREGHFLVPESGGEVKFYLFGKDAESLDLHRSLFANDRGTFISPSFDCGSNFTKKELDFIYERNSVFKDLFSDKKTFKREIVPPVCGMFKVKMIELDTLALMGEDKSAHPLVFNFRDPRGRLSKVKGVKDLCSSMQSDLDFIEKLPSNIVIRLRFEDLFAKPRNEIQRLLKKLRLVLKEETSLEKDLVLPPRWEMGGNSLNKINKWKSKLSLEDIKTIENECREVISRMEYHIVS